MLDKNAIKEFEEEYQRKRVTKIGAIDSIMKKLKDHEEIYGKEFYLFSVDEIRKMLHTFTSISVNSVRGYLIVMKGAANYFMKEDGIEVENNYANISKEMIKEVVTPREETVITREALNNVEERLKNGSDKAILELLFIGANSTTNMSDITFFSRENVLPNLMIRMPSGKELKVEEKLYNLILKGIDEPAYFSYRGKSCAYNIRNGELMKYRVNCQNIVYDIGNYSAVMNKYGILQRKLLSISQYLKIDVQATRIEGSGFIHYVKKGMSDSKMDLISFLNSNEGQDIMNRYRITNLEYATRLVNMTY